MKTTKAFTLAEVLITVGIIGIVASMTLPLVINHYKKKEATSRLKQFYSMMLQAITFSEAVNGDSNEWPKPHARTDNDGYFDYEVTGKNDKDFFMKYLAPYMKYVSIKDGMNTIDKDGNKSGTLTTVYLANGSSFAFNNGECWDIQFDINGLKKPNLMGKDQFVYFFCFTEDTRKRLCNSNKKAFCVPTYYAETRELAKNLCKQSAYRCTKLLQYDNWEFKDDYPYKL